MILCRSIFTGDFPWIFTIPAGHFPGWLHGRRTVVRVGCSENLVDSIEGVSTKFGLPKVEPEEVDPREFRQVSVWLLGFNMVEYMFHMEIYYDFYSFLFSFGMMMGWILSITIVYYAFSWVYYVFFFDVFLFGMIYGIMMGWYWDKPLLCQNSYILEMAIDLPMGLLWFNNS